MRTACLKAMAAAAFVAMLFATAPTAAAGENTPGQASGPAAGRASDPAIGCASDPADFLERMAGEWQVVSEATLGPGQEPIRTRISVTARLIGDQWIVAEGSGEAGGREFTWIFTLGYNPAEKQFVGTWVDSNQSHLWTYTGALDDDGTTLTLETEGPIMGDPSTTAQYREFIEVKDADHHVMRSQILGPDGEWFEFATADYRRSE